ncbi:MAG: glucosaminidase domain-containing protein [Bacteroidota bacterium]
MRIRVVLFLVFLFLIPIISHPETEEEGRSRGVKSVDPAPAPKLTPSIFIMDKGQKPIPQLISFMQEFNSTLDTVYLVRMLGIYLAECKLEGVNHDVAVVQMCLETGFLRFNGSVSRFQNNFCGLGAINAYTAGDWFESIEDGIRAHIQHLKGYASIEPLNAPPVDKRFYHIRRGTAITVYDLTGRWATDPKYGEKMDWLLRKLYEK